MFAWRRVLLIFGDNTARERNRGVRLGTLGTIREWFGHLVERSI